MSCYITWAHSKIKIVNNSLLNPAFEIFKFVTFFVTNLNSHPNLVEITFVTFDVTNLKFRSLPFHLELEILMTRVIGIGNKRN